VPARPDTEFQFPGGPVLVHGRDLRTIDWEHGGSPASVGRAQDDRILLEETGLCRVWRLHPEFGRGSLSRGRYLAGTRDQAVDGWHRTRRSLGVSIHPERRAMPGDPGRSAGRSVRERASFSPGSCEATSNSGFPRLRGATLGRFRFPAPP
jgi:hypothetical protein